MEHHDWVRSEISKHLDAWVIYNSHSSWPDPSNCYIVYTDVSDVACRAQLSQEQDGQELPAAFLPHTFTDTQQKSSTTEQEAYGIY